jgi:Tripartite tricarboxylate transporter family receptor/His Kinase A (phospho-acceptor) domain
MRTPLNAIIGLTEMMVTNAARFGTEKALEPLRRVNAAGTHLLSLINEVLDLSKIEAGKLELNPEPVNIARMLAGRIDFVFGVAANTFVHVRNGDLKVYAVMAKTRWAAAPDIPTIDEAGVPGLYASYWHGLWVPKGTPKEPITRLNSAVQAALADTTVRQRLADQGYDVLPREHREMGQGDPGRQHQAAGIKSRSKIGKTFHNVSLN